MLVLLEVFTLNIKFIKKIISYLVIKQMKRLVKKGLSDVFGPVPSQNLKNIFFSVMTQWPKASCYVSQQIHLVIQIEFPPKHYQVTLPD